MKYRVIQRPSMFDSMVPFFDLQKKRWWGWQTIISSPSRKEVLDRAKLEAESIKTEIPMVVIWQSEVK